MSYLWYTWVGFLTTILIGLLVSWFTGPSKYSRADKRLFTPVIHGFLCSRDSQKAVRTFHISQTLEKSYYEKYAIFILSIVFSE